MFPDTDKAWWVMEKVTFDRIEKARKVISVEACDKKA
jgi:hypothetical protein